MPPAPYSGELFRLKDKCVLLHVHEPNKHALTSVPIQIINMGVHPNQCLEVTDTAAFILRFLLQKVDTSLIREMLKSEFEGLTTDAEADAQIDAFINHYLKTSDIHEQVLEVIPGNERPGKRALGHIKPKQKSDFQQPFKLDFTVNPVGWTVFKLPLR